MVHEVRKAAEQYVKQQVGTFTRRVPQKDVKAAIRKVTKVLEEVRNARTAAGQQAKSALTCANSSVR